MINRHQAFHYLRHFLSAKRKGHGIHSPFAYRLCEEVFYNPFEYYDFELLYSIRRKLLEDPSELEVRDLGAGSKTFKTSTRPVQDIAAKGISTRRQAELLYRLIQVLNCRQIIELGTSLGLTSLYLAKGNKNIRVTSIEGSEALVRFATGLSHEHQVHNIEFIQGHFHDKLPEVLQHGPAPDLLYIDGNHTYEATLHYFQLGLERSHNNSVFVFDDIYWSQDMTRAWHEIRRHPAVRLSIDTFYTGLIFFREEIRQKTDLKLWL
jgi:predicted O-methyltransferase YrrM